MLQCLRFFIKVSVNKEQIHRRIGVLKRQFSDSKRLKEEEMRLSALRTQLEKEMLALKQEIQGSHYQSGEIESKKSLVAACRQKMLEIDHLLDDLEEWTEEKTGEVQEELISLILKIHPEEKDVYQDLSSKLNFNLATKHRIDLVIRHLELITNALEMIKVKRMEVKRRGVLSYVLGPNPNVVIGKNLKNVCDEAQTCVELDPQEEGLKKELQDLIVHCQGRWGFQTIDKVLSPFKERLEQYLSELQDHEKKLQDEIIDIETQIADWIERYSQSGG